jgi:hypothetical protein
MGFSVCVRTEDFKPRSGKTSRRERRIVAQAGAPKDRSNGVQAEGEDAILGKARKQTLSPVGATENEQSSSEPLFNPTHDEFSRRHLSPWGLSIHPFLSIELFNELQKHHNGLA